jgi:hypothetical protein
MSFSLSHYVHHSPKEMFLAAARAAHRVSESEWELGAWLLAIERTRAYESLGFRSTIGYAVASLGLEAQKAGNLLRIMGVLEELPRLSSAFKTGEIGYAKVREVTRVVTQETEGAWLEFARSHTTDQVRQRVVTSPAAFERRFRSIRNQADSLFSRGEASRVEVPDSTSDLHQPGPAQGLAMGSSAEPIGKARSKGSQSTPTESAKTLPLEAAGIVSDREQTLVSIQEDGLLAPQRVRLVVELSAEEYAEWGATVERVSRQLGRRASSREVILELARRHVASTGGCSLQRNPVVVRLEPDGSGFVQTDRGPMAISHQSSEDYLARADSIVVPGAQVSVLPLGGRRRKRLPSQVLQALVARSAGCCECCSQRGLLHIHHIRPLSRGGTNELENLRLLCSNCHSREHDQDFKPGSPWERARDRRRRRRNLAGRQARARGSDP